MDIINDAWCSGYPIHTDNNTKKSYTYINGTSSCWQNTFGLNISNRICRPQTSQPMAFWWNKCIFPAIILFIAFIYSMPVIWNLIKHLWIKEHNWIYEPSKLVKWSAIICVIFLSVAFLGGWIFVFYMD